MSTKTRVASENFGVMTTLTNGVPSVRTDRQVDYETIVGPQDWAGGGMHLTRNKRSGGVTSGYRIVTDKLSYQWSDWPAANRAVVIAHLPLPTTSLSSDINRAMASTGPITPRVNLPLSMFELRELPRMLKQAGDLLHNLVKKPSKLLTPSEAASSTLAYQFGWAPIVSDITRLLDFSSTVDKRLKYINKLRKGKTITRRSGLGSDSLSNLLRNVVVDSSKGAIVTRDVEVTTTRKKWGSTSWRMKPDRIPPGGLPDLNFREGFKVVYGLNRNTIPIAIWKALPWTWLIDWFINISDLLTISSNRLDFQCTNMWVMTHTRTTRKWAGASVNSKNLMWDLSSYSGVYETKSRTLHPSPRPSITLGIPLLDPFKASVLGSLTILRIRRAGR